MIAENQRRPDQERSPDSREALFQAAVKLFARRGYAATGVRELAREAQVSLAAVNYFYGSKLGLLKAVIDDFFSRLKALVEPLVSQEAPPEKKLRLLARTLAAFYRDNRAQMLIVLTELPHEDPEITEFKLAWVKQLFALFSAHLAAPVERERGLKIPLPLLGPALVCLAASHFLVGPIWEKLDHGVYEPEFLDRYPDLIADLFLFGVTGLLTHCHAHKEGK